jgi:hypothetical protein
MGKLARFGAINDRANHFYSEIGANGLMIVSTGISAAIRH